MLLTVFEHLDRFAPSKLLPVIDLAQVQDMALHHPPPCNALVLHHAKIAMDFAVLLANRGAQKHDGDNYPQIAPLENALGLHYGPLANLRVGKSDTCVPKNLKIGPESAKFG